MRHTMKGQKLSCFFVATFVLTLVSFGLMALDSIAPAAQAKPIELRFAEDEPAASMFCKTRFWWAEEIEKRTNGRLKIKIYPGGSLANAKNAIDAVRVGLADGGMVVSVFHPGRTPLATVSQCPTGDIDLYTGYMAMQYLINHYKPFQNEFARYNQKCLWSTATGTQRLIAKRPVGNLDKIKGVKIRATAQLADLVGKLGAIPVFFPTGETYEALQRATVEGVVFGLSHMRPLRFWEVAKHLLMFEGIGISNCGFGTINRSVWNKMPKDIQKVVTEVSNEYAVYISKMQIDLEENVLEEFRAVGVTVYRMSAEDKKVIIAKGEEVAGEWKKDMDAKGLPGSEILDLFLRKAAEYQAEVKAKGYPWAEK